MGFTDVEDLNSKQYTLLNWFMWGTGLLLTLIRFLVRYYQFKRLFWDDVLQLAAMISLTILAVLNQLQREIIYSLQALAPPEGDPAEKTFKHEITDDSRYQAKLQFVFILMFWVCLWTVKGSILMFYRRLFFNLEDYMRWWWAVTIACIVTILACILANFLECLPLEKRFELDLQGSCSAEVGTRFVAVTTGLDILTDLCLMALPIKLLVGLRISLKQKIGVGLIFSLSFLIIIFSILRVNEIYISLSTLDPNLNVSMSLWSILEAAVAVVVGALPSLKSFLKSKGDSSYGSRKFGSDNPYIRSNTSGSKSLKGPKATQTSIYALQSLKGRPTDVRVFESAEALRSRLAVPEPVLGNENGITITKDVMMRSHSQRVVEERDGDSIESFIHAS